MQPGTQLKDRRGNRFTVVRAWPYDSTIWRALKIPDVYTHMLDVCRTEHPGAHSLYFAGWMARGLQYVSTQYDQPELMRLEKPCQPELFTTNAPAHLPGETTKEN